MTQAAELKDVITDNARQAAESLDETRQTVQAKGRRARKQVAKAAKANRKELAKAAKANGKELAKAAKSNRQELAKAAKAARAELTGEAKKARGRKRRWPFLLIVVAAAGAGVTAYVLSRRPQQTFSADADRLDEPMTSSTTHHSADSAAEPIR